MSIEMISLLLVSSLLMQMVIGIPLAFATGSTAAILAILLFGPDSLLLIVSRIQDMMGNHTLIAVPLFIMMGTLLERGGVMGQLFHILQMWIGRLPGGLAISVIIAGAVLAAMVGIAGAEIVTLGLVALPALLKNGYDKSLSLGVICASGSLGTMIPPSVLLIVYGLIANVPIADLFAAALIPGLLLAGVYCCYVIILCVLKPDIAPRVEAPNMGFIEKIKQSRAVLFPVVLIAAVLGSIYAGIATPTEAAAIGVLGAIIAAVLNRKFSFQIIKESISQTGSSLGMVMWVFFGANALVSVYALANGISYINSLVMGLDLPPIGILLVMLLALFVLGMLLDWIAIALLTMPIFIPLATSLGYDPIWFGVIFALMMQTSYLSPPFGPAAFYLKGVTPSDISLGDIFRSVWPFLLLQVFVVALVIVFPGIALWLPKFIQN